MTSAINMFLRATIRENGIPFSLKLDVPNETTKEAIEEGRKKAYDKNEKSFSSIEELRKELDIWPNTQLDLQIASKKIWNLLKSRKRIQIIL